MMEHSRQRSRDLLRDFAIVLQSQAAAPVRPLEAIAVQLLHKDFRLFISITENNVAVKSAQIKIGSSNYPVTGGKITLGLAAGSYSGTIVTDTASLAINLTVEAKNVPADGNAPEAQSRYHSI